MPGPLLGAVVLNLGTPGVADPAERLERIYEWRVARVRMWLLLSTIALAATLAPLAIDLAVDGDPLDGTGRFFLVVAAVAWAALIGGMEVRLQRLEGEYSTAQALLAAVRVAPVATRPPAAPDGAKPRPPSAGPATQAPPPRPPGG